MLYDFFLKSSHTNFIGHLKTADTMRFLLPLLFFIVCAAAQPRCCDYYDAGSDSVAAAALRLYNFLHDNASNTLHYMQRYHSKRLQQLAAEDGSFLPPSHAQLSIVHSEPAQQLRIVADSAERFRLQFNFSVDYHVRGKPLDGFGERVNVLKEINGPAHAVIAVSDVILDSYDGMEMYLMYRPDRPESADYGLYTVIFTLKSLSSAYAEDAAAYLSEQYITMLSLPSEFQQLGLCTACEMIVWEGWCFKKQTSAMFCLTKNNSLVAAELL